MWTRAALRMFLAGSVIGCAGSAKQPAPNAPAIAAFPLEQRAGMRRVTVGLWKASFSPDGKRLVAGRLDRGLEVVELATGARTRITQFGKDPAWSPDGRLIAFVDGSGNAEQVWLVAAAGGEPRMVA
jgi:hypothetical protein